MNPASTRRQADASSRSTTTTTTSEPVTRPRRPGWPEVGAAAVAFGVLFLLTRQVLHHIPDDRTVAEGLARYALSALIGLAAFVAAFALRIRDLSAFGVRRVRWTWLLAGAGCGVLAFILSFVVGLVYTALSGHAARNIQTGYQDAANGGVLALTATLLLGAVATPIGEELAYRGVLANALDRYGPWVAVLGSAVVFAFTHGINPVTPVAFVTGVVAALLLRKTGSVWPGVCVHLMNNTLSTLLSVLVTFLPAPT